jgi:2-iminobutanoate/2-iminopropanoate deaminase
MAKLIISTERAPAAIGPYSQAVSAGGLVFLSGQIPIDPATRALVPGDVRRQTRQVLDNLKAVLAASGATLGDVVKTTIYLTNLADFNAVNEIYAETFSAEPPARATVGVAALPMGAKVEIDAIAVLSRAP